MAVSLSGAAVAGVVTFTPVADAYANEKQQNQINGALGYVYVNGNPVSRGYLRFNVQGLTGPVRRATLQLYARSSSTAGFELRSLASNTWSESTLTWRNAPPPSTTVTARSGAFTTDRWISIDVTSLVSRNGLVSFALTTTSTTGMWFASKEGGAATAPRLVVDSATPPVNTTAPSITGTPREKDTLTAQPGAWSGTLPIAYGYQWQRCDAQGATCTAVAGATAQTYLLTPADIGATMRVVMTARNEAGEATATSAATAPVRGRPPVGTSAPTVSGSAREASALTAEPGTWSGTDPISLGYQWQRCDAHGGACTNLSAATAKTYALTPDDIGTTVRVLVTASNVAGAATSTSPATASVQGRPPTSTSAPLVTGTPEESATLTAQPGTWSGTEPIQEAYQWQRCDAQGAACVDVPDATALTYVLTPVEIGSTVRVVATARNVAGEATAGSPPSPQVKGRPAHNLASPDITGDAVEGKRLTIDVGSWSGTPTISYTFQWRRCDAAGDNCVDVANATASTLLLTTSEMGSSVRTVVTGANSFGQETLTTAPSPIVVGRPPVNISPPTLTGTPIDGQRLTADRGVWGGTATIRYTYRWRRCDARGESCAEIAGAAGQTYLLTPADVGATIRVAIIASNSLGQRTETSAPSGPAAGRPPASTAAPTITGTVAEGEWLTIGKGSWTGTPPLSFAYRWQRCDSQGDACGDLSSGTGKTYRLTPADVGATVRAVVAASNVAGETEARSTPSAAVEARPPTPPRNITAVGAGGTVTLDWSNNAESDVAGYRVHRQDGDAPWAATPIATTVASRFVDRPATDGRTYSYRVTAVDTTGLTSAPSANVSALPTGAIPKAAAAGDIACDPGSASFNGGLGTATNCRQNYTAAQLAGADTVFALGDLQYENGALTKFRQSYDPSWGRVKALTHPAVGNHEYLTVGAAGYFDYFNGVGVQDGPAGDRTKGYYSYNLGSWHVVVLNSNCAQVGGCGAGSAQERWLRADLAATGNRCTLAYWHHPRFSGGHYTADPTYQPFWQALYEARAELVLNGHDHNYQRFAPQDPTGAADPVGVREFVVGTGGKNRYAVATTLVDNRAVAFSATSGVLKLDLRPDGYDWAFEPENSTLTDSGSAACTT